MNNLNLGSDESVIHTTQKLIISGVGHEAILTDRRLILVECNTGSIREDIPFPDIRRAVAGTNALHEPTITLTIRSPGGTTRETELVFFHRAAGQNIQDRDKCVAVLRDHEVPVQASPPVDVRPYFGKLDNADAVTVKGNEPAGRPAVPEMTLFGGMVSSARQPLPEEGRERSPLFTIAAAVLVIGICIGSLLILVPGPGTNQSPEQHKATVPEAGVTPAPHQLLTRTPEPTATSAPNAPLPAQYLIPKTGIWVRVAYPGNFTGQIAANGLVREVNSSSDQFYQMWMSSGKIDGFIEKKDGSVRNMSIQIYKDGTLVTYSNTSIPLGIAEIHATV